MYNINNILIPSDTYTLHTLPPSLYQVKQKIKCYFSTCKSETTQVQGRGMYIPILTSCHGDPKRLASNNLPI